MKNKSIVEENDGSNQNLNLTKYMCFIEVLLKLINERNFVRAVLSILYNKWENYNLVISSYTFEDFSNRYTVGGQRIQYDEIIKEKANCAIFIVTDGVGEKTLNEYRLAIDTLKKQTNI